MNKIVLKFNDQTPFIQSLEHDELLHLVEYSYDNERNGLFLFDFLIKKIFKQSANNDQQLD